VRAMARWRTQDLIIFTAVMAVAVAVRVVDLGSPSRLVFDESYYAQDACLYVGLSQDVCVHNEEFSWVHPPLGKWLIALGISLGGYHPAAWRSTAVVAGIVMVAALFVLARRLTASPVAAGAAAGVIALDPLSIISSRVAMLDIFVACAGVLAVTFAVLHRDWLARRKQVPGRATRLRPWLLAAGVAGGVAVATKWSGVLVLGIVMVLTVAWVLEARGGGRIRALRAMAPSLVAGLVVLPAAIYVASYVGRLEGELFAIPWQQDGWFRVYGGRQLRMAAFHVGLDGTHPYASPAWSWLLGKRAVPYFFEVDAAGRYREILAFANLALWLPGVAAAGWATTAFFRRRDLWRPEFVVMVAIAGSYLPWLIPPAARPFVFLYYIVPTIPFLALAIGWAVVQATPTVRRWGAVGVAAVAISVYVFWTPLIYGWPLSYDAWRMRILFADCTPAELTDGQLRPPMKAGPIPDGWCWV
jgi:dolichyl-phosphate-mannose-protein mannosyltransferase